MDLKVRGNMHLYHLFIQTLKHTNTFKLFVAGHKSNTGIRLSKTWLNIFFEEQNHILYKIYFLNTFFIAFKFVPVTFSQILHITHQKSCGFDRFWLMQFASTQKQTAPKACLHWTHNSFLFYSFQFIGTENRTGQTTTHIFAWELHVLLFQKSSRIRYTADTRWESVCRIQLAQFEIAESKPSERDQHNSHIQSME